VRITLGTAKLSPVAVGELRVGSVIELEEAPDAPVRVQADGRFVGEGVAVSVSGPDGGPRLAVSMRAAKTVVLAVLAAMLLVAATTPMDAWAQAAQSATADAGGTPAGREGETPSPRAASADDIENQKVGGPRDGGGKKSDKSGGLGWAEVLHTLAALAVVAGLIFATRWLLRRLNRRLAAGVGGGSETLRVLTTTPLGGRGELVLVKFGGRLVLVGATAQGMAPLSEITDAAEVAAVEERVGRRGRGPGREENKHSP